MYLSALSCRRAEDLQSVLYRMKLANGIVWPIPLILDVSEEEAEKVEVGKEIALKNNKNEIIALLHLEEKYSFDKKEILQNMYGTEDETHPGVRMVQSLKPIFLAGKVDLIKRKDSELKEYELTPKQVRRLFEERGWAKIVGFHTRNVIHKSHEFIQKKALELENCDGLFIHPVIGKKKRGDFDAKYIIKSYEIMTQNFYPPNSVIFATFATYSRYAGPREALFTALCRKNFGCSHFIVGRDHTGVGNFYHPKASHNIFDRFPEIGIKPICFDEVVYSKPHQQYLQKKDLSVFNPVETLSLSGTEARRLLEQGEMPPEWFMRPEIALMISDALKNGEEVFVKND